MYLSPTERNSVSENMPFFGGWYVIARKDTKRAAGAAEQPSWDSLWAGSEPQIE